MQNEPILFEQLKAHFSVCPLAFVFAGISGLIILGRLMYCLNEYDHLSWYMFEGNWKYPFIVFAFSYLRTKYVEEQIEKESKRLAAAR